LKRHGIWVAFAALALLPGAALANIQEFSWTYGGGADPVYAFGTLTATPDASITGAYDILGGSGTRITSAGSFAVSLIYFGDPGPFPGAEGLTGPCSYSPSTNCNVTDAGAGGATANLGFDNLLYANNAPGYQLDGDGIVLFEPNAPSNDSKYYSVWDIYSPSTVAPPDQEFDPYTYNGVNLANPFTVKEVSATPEPGFYGFLTLGLSGIAAVSWRRRNRG
jgi:hypothetical protein